MNKQSGMLSKTLVIGIIILLLGVSVTPTIGISNYNDDTTPPVTTISFDPPEPNGLCGWYVSDVNVTLNATDDLSGVKEIYYRVAEGEWKNHTGDFLIFILDHDCLIDGLIEFYAVDFAGNQEETKSFCCINIDQLPPEIEYELEVKYCLFWYDIIITNSVEDACSGVCYVEFYLNGILQETVTGPGPVYEWGFRWYGGLRITIWIIYYDCAGNQAKVVINASDINSRSRVNTITQYSNNVWFVRFFDRFPMLEVIISRIISL